MAKIKYFYDKRKCKKGYKATLNILVSHNCKTALWNLGLTGEADDWDESRLCFVAGSDIDYRNEIAAHKYNHALSVLTEITKSGSDSRMSATDIRDLFMGRYCVDGYSKEFFISGLRQSIAARSGRTQQIYQETMKRVVEYITNNEYIVTDEDLAGTRSSREQRLIREEAFLQACDDVRVRSLKYADINPSWLKSFDSHLAVTSPSVNARAIHLRNIRSVFNDQLDDGNDIPYPFRKFKIKKEETVKRSLSPGQLRDFFNADIDDSLREYLDMFKLTFMLIGINTTDLVKLKEVVNGYIEYRRDKTHRLYTIKVEPEAMEIIDRYRGKKCLLNVLDRYTDYKDYMQRINGNLKRIGTVTYSVSPARNHLPVREYHPMYPGITLYWARHSWATIASELDIPKEVISHALGHSMGSRTTAIYIDLDRRKVDVANRIVLDWVLYGKYTNWATAMVEMRDEMFRVKSSQVNLSVV